MSPSEVQAAIAALALPPRRFALREAYRATIAEAVTDAPHGVIAELASIADHLGVRVSLRATPTRPLARSMARVRRALSVLPDR